VSLIVVPGCAFVSHYFMSIHLTTIEDACGQWTLFRLISSFVV